MWIIPFFILLVLSFFILFILSKRDFVLLRKNISVSLIFDYMFIALLVAFIIGRLLFILESSQFFLISPLRFIHVLRLPGFSILGFFIGGFFAVFFLFRKTKAISRIFDIFSLSFFPLFTASIFGSKISFGQITVPIFFIFLFILFIFLLKSHVTYRLKDGSISALFILFVSIFSFLINFNLHTKPFIVMFTLVQWISICTAIFSIAFYFLNQNKHLNKND